MHAIAHGSVQTPSESLHLKLTLREKSLATLGIEPPKWCSGPTSANWATSPPERYTPWFIVHNIHHLSCESVDAEMNLNAVAVKTVNKKLLSFEADIVISPSSTDQNQCIMTKTNQQSLIRMSNFAENQNIKTMCNDLLFHHHTIFSFRIWCGHYPLWHKKL